MVIKDLGKWKAPDEIPEALKAEYDSLKTKYPDAGDDMWEYFKRGGYLWHRLARFPSWENYNPSKNALNSRMTAGDAVFAMNPEPGKSKWKPDGGEVAKRTVA